MKCGTPFPLDQRFSNIQKSVHMCDWLRVMKTANLGFHCLIFCSAPLVPTTIITTTVTPRRNYQQDRNGNYNLFHTLSSSRRPGCISWDY